MKTVDELRLAKGVVTPSFVGKDGRKIPFDTRNNTLSYMAAEAVAAAFGGDPAYIPARMGFIYGNSSAGPGGSAEEAITRNQDWEDLLDEIGRYNDTYTADIQVVDFSYSPTLGGEGRATPGSSSSGSSDPEEGDYDHILPTGSNAITFHAVSTSDAGVLRPSESFQTGRYIYQCVLLGYHEGRYYVIARASLKDGGAYRQKPDGFEVALDWTVVFH